MITGTEFTVIACFIASIFLVIAEWRGWPIRRAIFKVTASSAFVLLAIQLGATTSTYGRIILTALALSWLGDVFLLSRTTRVFLLGIASFLLSHIVFSIAFATLSLSTPALITGFIVLSCLGMIIIKWLWGYLLSFYRIAVTAYLVAIISMCSFAIAVSTTSGNWMLATGALAFAASDLSVARDRFIAPSFKNRVWGLPLYYAAQVMLAFSIEYSNF